MEVGDPADQFAAERGYHHVPLAWAQGSVDQQDVPVENARGAHGIPRNPVLKDRHPAATQQGIQIKGVVKGVAGPAPRCEGVSGGAGWSTSGLGRTHSIPPNTVWMYSIMVRPGSVRKG